MSTDQRRQLARIEWELRRDDPELVAAFDRCLTSVPVISRARWRVRAGIALLAIGTALLVGSTVVGSLGLGSLGLGVGVACVGVLVTWFVGHRARLMPRPIRARLSRPWQRRQGA